VRGQIAASVLHSPLCTLDDSLRGHFSSIKKNEPASHCPFGYLQESPGKLFGDGPALNWERLAEFKDQSTHKIRDATLLLTEFRVSSFHADRTILTRESYRQRNVLQCSEPSLECIRKGEAFQMRTS